MSTIPATIVSTREYDVITWPAMANTDVGVGVETAMYRAISVQGKGDGTSFTVTGSNDGGTTFSPLLAIPVFTFVGSKTPVGQPALNAQAQQPQALQYRPEVTGGTNSTITMVGFKQI